MLHIRGSSKTDDALEMLGRAANMFKMAKKWSQAGNTFTKIANHHVKVRDAAREVFIDIFVRRVPSMMLLPTMLKLPTVSRKLIPRKQLSACRMP